MPEYPTSRRHSYLDRQRDAQGILQFLKPTEQEIIKLHYALEGNEFHSLEKICQKYPDVTMQELNLLLEKVDRMIGIQKNEIRKDVKS